MVKLGCRCSVLSFCATITCVANRTFAEGVIVSYPVILETTATQSAGLLELLRQIAVGSNDSPGWFEIWGPPVLSTLITAFIILSTTLITISYHKIKDNKTNLLSDIRQIAGTNIRIYNIISSEKSTPRKEDIKNVLRDISSKISESTTFRVNYRITFVLFYHFTYKVINNSLDSKWLRKDAPQKLGDYPYHFFTALSSELDSFVANKPSKLKKRSRLEDKCFDSFEKYKITNGEEPPYSLILAAWRSLRKLQPYTFKIPKPSQVKKKQLWNNLKALRVAFVRLCQTIWNCCLA